MRADNKDRLYKLRWSQCPRGLRNELVSSARTLGSWVRIPLKALMSVCALGSGLETGSSPVQGVLPTEGKRSVLRMPHAPEGATGIWMNKCINKQDCLEWNLSETWDVSEGADRWSSITQRNLWCADINCSVTFTSALFTEANARTKAVKVNVLFLGQL
jgi:hypothetical protein